jgi:predicted permease
MPTPLPLAALQLHSIPAHLTHIAYFIILPMLLLVGLGFLIQRTLGLDNPTLVRLNFYFAIPGTVFYSIVSSPLSAGDVGTVVGFTLAVQTSLALLTLAVAAVKRIPRDQRAAMTAANIFYNSGNYGLPLQEWAFRSTAESRGSHIAHQVIGLQTIVMLVQNVTNFTLGVLMASSVGGPAGAAAAPGRRAMWKANLLQIAKFPPLYALLAALLVVQLRHALGPDHSATAAKSLRPFWDVATLLRQAFIAIALCTLGAQLALVKHHATRYPVKTSILLRLLAGPAVGFLLIYAFGLTGLVAQVMLISTSTPTAVNAMLVCYQFNNHPDYLARVVFYTTLLSPLTITPVIFLAQSGLVPWLVF